MKRKKRGRKSRYDILRGMDLGIAKKAPKLAPKPHIIDYKALKTELGKIYSNYFIIGCIQPYSNTFLEEYQALAEKRKIIPKSYPFFKDSKQAALIKARSLEEAFHIYYKRAIINFSGGIGNIKEFKNKRKYLMDINTYYDGTTFIQKLKINPDGEEYKIALINASVLLMEYDNKPFPTNHPLNPLEVKRRNTKEKKNKVIDKDEE